MADPVIIVISPADTWQLVATNVTQGFIHVLGGPSRYVQTYRDTGEAAPTDTEEGVSLDASGSEAIAATAGIDVYVQSLGVPGKVRVDL